MKYFRLVNITKNASRICARFNISIVPYNLKIIMERSFMYLIIMPNPLYENEGHFIVMLQNFAQRRGCCSKRSETNLS